MTSDKRKKMVPHNLSLNQQIDDQKWNNYEHRVWNNERKAKWASNQEKRYQNRFKPFHNQTRTQYEASYMKGQRYQYRKNFNKRSQAINNWQSKKYEQGKTRKYENSKFRMNRAKKALPAWQKVLRDRERNYYSQTPRQKYVYNEVMAISRDEANKMNEVREITNLARNGFI